MPICTLINKWHVIGTESKNCTEMHRDYFFRKHCMIAEWMESSLNKDDIVVVFDSDVVPYRSNISMNNWTITGEDIVMYERIWNNEIAAGNYIARNNPRARQFLREWSKFEYEMPPNAFSSSDNGKLWQHDTFLLILYLIGVCKRIHNPRTHFSRSCTIRIRGNSSSYSPGRWFRG